jgi:hypothetical protein
MIKSNANIKRNHNLRRHIKVSCIIRVDKSTDSDPFTKTLIYLNTKDSDVTYTIFRIGLNTKCMFLRRFSIIIAVSAFVFIFLVRTD